MKIIFLLFFISCSSGQQIVAKKKSPYVYCEEISEIKQDAHNVLDKEVFRNGYICRDSSKLKIVREDYKVKYDLQRKIINKTRKRETNQSRIKDINTFIDSNRAYVKFKQSAIDRNPKVGMPEKLVFLAFGKPRKVNKTTGKWGTHKQLVYSRLYIYIENGFITSWQN